MRECEISEVVCGPNFEFRGDRQGNYHVFPVLKTIEVPPEIRRSVCGLGIKGLPISAAKAPFDKVCEKCRRKFTGAVKLVPS